MLQHRLPPSDNVTRHRVDTYTGREGGRSREEEGSQAGERAQLTPMTSRSYFATLALKLPGEPWKQKKENPPC